MRKSGLVWMFTVAMLWSASVALAAGVAGDWTLAVSADGESHQFPIRVEQSGDQVTAKIGEDPITGTFKDGVLTMAGKVNSDVHGYGAELKMTGKLADGKISGELRWDTYEATFTMTPQ